MLSDAEVEIAASETLSLDLGVAEVVSTIDVVLVGSVEIGRTRHILGYHLGDILEDLRSRLSGGDILLHIILGDASKDLLSRWIVLGLSVLKLSGKGRVGTLPLVVFDHPGSVFSLEGSLSGSEESTGLEGDSNCI